MKRPKCPQCEINRFYIKNEKGQNLLVSVNERGEVIPVHKEESPDGFDASMLYCLGCSWQGSPTRLLQKKSGR